MLYNIILYIHVLSAVVSIGPLFLLVPIIKKMENADGEIFEGFVQSFQLSIRIVKHAGHVLVLSGIFLIIFSGWTWTTSWVLLTVAVMVGSIVFLARAFKPTIRTFGTTHFNKQVFISKLKKSTLQYILLLLFMLWLMVTKPTLW